MQNVFIVLFTCLISFTSAHAHAQQVGRASEPLSAGELVTLIEKLSCDQVLATIEETAKNLQSQGVGDMATLHQRRLIETYAIIRRCGLNTVTAEGMMNGQLAGMVGALNDPHSDFLDRLNLKEAEEDLRGNYVGVGVELEPITRDGKFVGVRVIEPLPGSSAEKEGVQPNDQILEIAEDGSPSHRVSSFRNFSELMVKIAGVEGSIVSFTILRDGISQPMTVRLQRSHISKNEIRGKVLPSGWVWIRIMQFSGKDFCNELSLRHRTLRNKAGINFRGTILDLQNNPGGTLDGALCTVSLFARNADKNKSVILFEDRDGVHDLGTLSYITSPGNLTGGKPLIVLVNLGSASASEIVAKALQYYGIGEVVGTMTFGKGSVQQMIPLSDGNVAVKLTTAQYLIGSELEPVGVQLIGVTPNIFMDNPKDINRKFSSERDLPGNIKTSINAKEKQIIPTNIRDPRLYNEIIDVLSKKPFEFTLKK